LLLLLLLKLILLNKYYCCHLEDAAISPIQKKQMFWQANPENLRFAAEND